MESVFDKVFQIQDLFENILQNVLFEEASVVRPEDTKSLRLVSKHWLVSVMEVLYKQNQKSITGVALITIENSDQSEQFLKLLEGNQDISPLPYQVASSYSNQEMLKNLLQQCGQGLVNLAWDFTWPIHNSSSVPELFLPNLKQLEIATESDNTVSEAELAKEFLQKIFNAAEGLCTLKVSFSETPAFEEGLQLAKNIRNLHIKFSYFQDRRLTDFLLSQKPIFSNITCLHVEHSMLKSDLSQQTLLDILSTCAENLKELSICGNKCVPESPRHYLRFPAVMKCLKELRLESSWALEIFCCPIDSSMCVFPKLETLELAVHSAQQLDKWLSCHSSGCMRKLIVRVGAKDGNLFAGSNSDKMTQIRGAYPNLVDLNVQVGT